jgi:hypothetical protein
VAEEEEEEEEERKKERRRRRSRLQAYRFFRVVPTLGEMRVFILYVT